MVDKVGGTPGQMTNHLTRRGARYYFRRKIPKALHAHYGKQEIVRALGTSDYSEAKRLAAVQTVITDAEWAALAAALAAPQHLDEGMADVVQHEVEGDAEWEADLSANPGWHDAAAEGRKQARESMDTLLSSMGLPTPQQLDHLNAFGGFDADNMPSLDKARKARRLINAPVSSPGIPASISPTHTGTPPPSLLDTVSLADLCDRWATERKPAARSVAKYNKAVERFYLLVGRVPIEHITRRHVVEFKDRLVETGVSIPQTNHTLDCLGTLFNFGLTNDLVQSNVARGVKLIDNRSSKAKRLPYTLDQLRIICANLPRPRDDREGFWLPLLGLYTGARLAELCQLTPSDVREETYFDADGERRAWCIYINNDSDGKRVKTASSVRRIPIHPVLIEQGFIDLAKSRFGKLRIFDLEPNKAGEFGQDFSKVYGKFLRGTCGITDPKRVFHSYRHTFKDVCRECGISKELADAMQGHDDGDSSSEYGGEFYPLRPLVQAITTYQIRGLTLPPVQ
ncbi:DUF6538 domain-containing protein [Burkholderia plantarii]|uniref:DUF6538 domain-containing protein n=1 Tax=Burkholderia plantarii TaxID=41899 RepID=UPI000AA8C5C6|nr:DUF6538 domain-containing protein [Burkholderia plantarii]GLZ22654.1 integrase [Burkholderia plantarii]